MKRYFDPEINVRMLDFEDVTTESGVPSGMTAVEVATEALGADESIDNILTMG